MKLSDDTTPLAQLKKKIEEFVKERDWEKFHSPKNLSMSIAIEAAELMEHFQWVDEKGSLDKLKEKEEEIKDELADICMFVLEFANLHGIDLSQAILKKLIKNSKKYPTDLVKGSSKKYTEYASNKPQA